MEKQVLIKINLCTKEKLLLEREIAHAYEKLDQLVFSHHLSGKRINAWQLLLKKGVSSS